MLEFLLVDMIGVIFANFLLMGGLKLILFSEKWSSFLFLFIYFFTVAGI